MILSPFEVFMTLNQFLERHCVGRMYGDCKASPCRYSSKNGCTHPKHPNNSKLPNNQGTAICSSPTIVIKKCVKVPTYNIKLTKDEINLIKNVLKSSNVERALKEKFEVI